MINLSGNGSIWAVAANNNQIICTISGMQLAAGVETYQILGQAYVVNSASNMYTVPANTTAFVKRIFLANSNASAAQAGIIVYANGTGNANNAINQITGNFTIPVGGFAVYDESGWTFFDALGNVLTSNSAGVALKSRTVIAPGTTTYTLPVGITSILVQGVGPGGGGGGANGATNNGAYGGGGGAGAYFEYFIANPAATYNCAVGNGGNGGTAAGGNGSNGSANTTFTVGGVVVTANFGLGGMGGTNGNNFFNYAGGAGGVASNGHINEGGQHGFQGFRANAALNGTGYAGAGGSSFFGGGGSAGTPTGNGGAANSDGAGGGGGSANGSAAGNGLGGNGANGTIIVWEFI